MARSGSAVERIASILFALASAPTPLSASEVVSIAGISPDTAVRYLEQLVKVNYVESTSDRYSLGLGILPLTYGACNHNRLRQAGMRTLWTLSDETGLNANLGVLWRNQVLYLGRAEAPPWRSFRCNIGRLAPLHCTAMGKVLLTFTLHGEMAGDLTRYTSHTIVDRAELRQEIQRIASLGYATDDSEWIEGIRCIAVPVRSQAGTAIAAVSVSGPSAQVDFESDNTIRAVVKAAYEIQSQLGFVA